MNNIPLFVFVCDPDFTLTEVHELRQFALIPGRNFRHSDTNSAYEIFDSTDGVCPVNAKHLLVFVSSFSGDISAAIEFAEKIKGINPEAAVYFRGVTDDSVDSTFDGSVFRGNKERFHGIIRQFVTRARQPAP